MTSPLLVTGATGYVGGRLRGRLESEGWRVRCLARRPTVLASRVGDATEVVEGDGMIEGIARAAHTPARR